MGPSLVVNLWGRPGTRNPRCSAVQKKLRRMPFSYSTPDLTRLGRRRASTKLPTTCRELRRRLGENKQRLLAHQAAHAPSPLWRSFCWLSSWIKEEEEEEVHETTWRDERWGGRRVAGVLSIQSSKQHIINSSSRAQNGTAMRERDKKNQDELKSIVSPSHLVCVCVPFFPREH